MTQFVIGNMAVHSVGALNAFTSSQMEGGVPRRITARGPRAGHGSSSVAVALSQQSADESHAEMVIVLPAARGADTSCVRCWDTYQQGHSDSRIRIRIRTWEVDRF